MVKFITKNLEDPLKRTLKKQDTYCLACKEQTDNKPITPKQVAIKFIAQASICVDCGSKKSVFVKEHKPNEKKKFFLQITKICIFIVKNAKKHTRNMFQKNLSRFQIIIKSNALFVSMKGLF